MQKFTLLICSLCTLIVLGIGLSSCKDDEPFVKPNLSVSVETLTVSEAVGTVEVEIVLDKAAPTDITVEYDLRGTATSPADYTVVGKEGEIEIPQGQTSATIEIQIVNDAIYEGNETIEISLEDVDSDDVIITNDDETVITITDDDPQITISMAVATVAANEDDGDVVVTVTLSAAAPQAVTIGYSLTGTAVDAVFGAAQTQPIPPQYWDYVVDVENQGELVIPQGATTAEIVVTIFTDFHLEDDETIIVTLNDASNGAQITANNSTTITVAQQNGKAIALVWDEDYTDVDMDLFLWDVGADPDGFLASSTNPDVDPQVELLIIPSIIDEGSFGASYTYYSGSENAMDFEVHFADYTDGVFEPIADRDIFPATYTLANINAWDAEGAPTPAIAQTFEITAGQVTNFSDPIVVPATGSRMATVALPSGIRKMKANQVKALRNIR